MTNNIENEKKENASEAKSGDAASGTAPKTESTKNSEKKDKLHAIANKAAELARKAFAFGKSVTKDVVHELKQINAIRKETVATATASTKKKDLAKVFWTKTSGKQRGIVIGLTVIIVFALYSALSTSGEQYHKEALALYKNKNYEKAFEFYKKSADKGFPLAFYDVGDMYMRGQGVPQSHIEALKWYKIAADKGVPAAYYYVGSIYTQGKGVPQNHVEAVKWYRLAAAKDYGFALFMLTTAYAGGEGVEKNYVRALMWAYLAEARDDLRALEKVTKLTDHRVSLEKAVTPQQITQAQQLATQCKKQKYENCDSLKITPAANSTSPQGAAPAPAVQPIAKDTSFTATITCSMGPNNLFNILACFAGGRGAAGTELELRNGDQYGLYKAHNMSNIGADYGQGLEIKLAQTFQLKAQNAHETLILGVRITGDQTGKKLFEKQVGQYGVISIGN